MARIDCQRRCINRLMGSRTMVSSSSFAPVATPHNELGTIHKWNRDAASRQWIDTKYTSEPLAVSAGNLPGRRKTTPVSTADYSALVLVAKLSSSSEFGSCKRNRRRMSQPGIRRIGDVLRNDKSKSVSGLQIVWRTEKGNFLVYTILVVHCPPSVLPLIVSLLKQFSSPH